MANDKIDVPTRIDNRHPMGEKKDHALTPWAIKGELILNCNCTIFCPCVVSLGNHAPTEGYCQAWAGVRIDEGHYGDEDLSGLNVGLVLEIPGLMARGNWKAAAYIDDRATHAAYHGLIQIFSGKARGTTGLFKVLVSEFLGAGATLEKVYPDRFPVGTGQLKCQCHLVGVPGLREAVEFVLSHLFFSHLAPIFPVLRIPR